LLEKLKLEREHAEIERVQGKALDNHRRLFEGLSMPYPGVRPIQSLRHLNQYCWNCKNKIDTRMVFECKACAWIVCQCGACGCGYPKSWPPPWV
jgi:hypothetical protein